MRGIVVFDVDGTLLDSYKKIVSVLVDVSAFYQLDVNYDEIYHFVTTKSVKEYLDIMEEKYPGASTLYLQKYENSMIVQGLMPNVKEVLESLKKEDYVISIYTHKGRDIFDILKAYEIESYFSDVITIEDGFARKPSSEAILYLRAKYPLLKMYYVGDRNIDMQMAANAKIDGILYKPKNSVVEPDGNEKYIITDLLDMMNIIGEEEYV